MNVFMKEEFGYRYIFIEDDIWWEIEVRGCFGSIEILRFFSGFEDEEE